MYSSENIGVLYETINATNLPPHLKNKTFLTRHVKNHIYDIKKSLVENNKAFLLYYIRLPEEIDFDSELKKHQLDLEETITLKRPSDIQFTEKVDVLEASVMDKELQNKLKEREELDTILAQQPEPKPEPIVEPEEETPYEKKRVTFRETVVEPEPGVNQKVDVVLLELAMVKQELSDIKKMFIALTTMIQKLNPSESHNDPQP